MLQSLGTLPAVCSAVLPVAERTGGSHLYQFKSYTPVNPPGEVGVLGSAGEGSWEACLCQVLFAQTASAAAGVHCASSREQPPESSCSSAGQALHCRATQHTSCLERQCSSTHSCLSAHLLVATLPHQQQQSSPACLQDRNVPCLLGTSCMQSQAVPATMPCLLWGEACLLQGLPCRRSLQSGPCCCLPAA